MDGLSTTISLLRTNALSFGLSDSLRLPWKDLLWILNAFQFVLDKVPPPDPEEELPYYHVNCSPEFILYHPSGFRKDSTPVELCSIKMQVSHLQTVLAAGDLLNLILLLLPSFTETQTRRAKDSCLGIFRKRCQNRQYSAFQSTFTTSSIPKHHWIRQRILQSQKEETLKSNSFVDES